MRGMALSVFHASFFFKLYLNFSLETVIFDYNINAEKHLHQQGRESFQCVFGFVCMRLSIVILQKSTRLGSFCFLIS